MTAQPPAGKASSLRSQPPPFRLPRARRHSGGAVVSLALHALILGLLVRHGARWLAAGGGDAGGPRGGGGGGSAAAVRYAQLPAPASPPAVERPAPKPAIVPPPATPKPVKPDVPQPEVAVTSPPVEPTGATDSGSVGGGGPGTGPGTGGGTGAGTGPGAGNDSGSGRGGDGEYISPPYARTVLLPAECARGRFTVRFWVEADGRVTQVTVEPLPKNGGCRREMLDKMMGYQFLPARTRDGRPVASVYQVQLQH